MKLVATFVPQTLTVTINAPTVSASTGTPVAREFIERPAYEGETEVTPGEETQVLSTSGLRMTSDITINPIPQNYGLITYNGSTITVS